MVNVANSSRPVARTDPEAARPVPAGREAERRFEQARREARERVPARLLKATDQGEINASDALAMQQMRATSLASMSFADTPALLRGALQRATCEGAAAIPAAGVTAAGENNDVQAAAFAATSSGEFSGRIANGPWAGLQLQISMHASGVIVRLQPASRGQLDRLVKGKAAFESAAKFPEAQSSSRRHNALPFDLEVSDAGLE